MAPNPVSKGFMGMSKVEEDMQRYQTKLQKSIELNQFHLDRKTKNARVISQRSASRLSEITEKRMKDEEETLNRFVQTAQQRERKLILFSRERSKRLKQSSEKKMAKYSAVQAKIQHLRTDSMEKQSAIEEKHMNIQKAVLMNRRTRVRNVMLRQEREQLRQVDNQRNQEQQRWQLDRRNMKVFEKHLMIDERLNAIKQRRASQQEFLRLANEMRLLKIQE
jgi:hypothetical protein